MTATRFINFMSTIAAQIDEMMRLVRQLRLFTCHDRRRPTGIRHFPTHPRLQPVNLDRNVCFEYHRRTSHRSRL
jgi:hypothetical protein